MAKLRRRARAFQLTGAGLNIEVCAFNVWSGYGAPETEQREATLPTET
jgi:hypothetical protein